jgi:AraC-like DNA-binding protein
VWLTSGAARVARPVEVWSRNRGGVAIDIAVRGGWEIGFAHAPDKLVTVPGGYASVSLFGADSIAGCVPFVSVPTEYVSLQFRDDAAMQAFGLDATVLNGVLGELAVRRSSRGRTYLVEASHGMLAAARAIRQAQYSGSSRLLYLRGKACELLANFPASKCVANPRMDAHDLSAADDSSLAALAASALGDSPARVDLRSLARRFGVTENRIARAFKSTYGTTPFGYANRARVTRGREMLLEGHMALIDVALACGYANHPAFSTAYRRTFGETPRDTRLRARRGGNPPTDATIEPGVILGDAVAPNDRPNDRSTERAGSVVRTYAHGRTLHF